MSKASREALVNEYKGHLLEYLIATDLAATQDMRQEFNSRISDNYKNQLTSYQNHLLNLDPALYKQLFLMAKEGASFVKKSFALEELKEVHLLGKDYERRGEPLRNREADIVLITNNQEIPLSLKFCKWDSFVNTKSGGAKSFLSQYFGDFPLSYSLQEEFNLKLEKGFTLMREEVSIAYGLEAKSSFDHWQEQGIPTLPGEVIPQAQKALRKFYHSLIINFHSAFESFYKTDPHLFLNSLKSLCGFLDEETYQVSLFYQKKTEEISLKDIRMKSNKDILPHDPENLFVAPLEGKSSFHLNLKGMQLQIRMKPMNSFWVPGLKVNCSCRIVD